MASFTILAITGLVQKYSASPISTGIVTGLGGIGSVRWIHHTAAIVMMVVSIYHIGAVGYRIYVERKRMSMLPGVEDIRNAIQSFKYYLGREKHPAQQGRYTFEEKAEYWAVVWGTVVMVITGFMMWNPIATTNIFPGQIIPAAKAAHGGEALLAVLAIILWHMYHVIIRTRNRSMYNGYLTEEEMLEEHPLELADIKAGTASPPVTQQGLAQRARLYLPSFAVIAAVLLIGVYYFVTFEETAIAYLPPEEEQVEVFVPLTPTPLPTTLPAATAGAQAGALTWNDRLGPLMASKCTSCHGASPIANLDLSSYQGALQGGDSGPAVVPGDPDASRMVAVQSAGSHPGQFSQEELALVVEWIAAGAPEQ
jgi:cytochrome b subunit of formate dehydrogenase